MRKGGQNRTYDVKNAERRLREENKRVEANTGKYVLMMLSGPISTLKNIV